MEKNNYLLKILLSAFSILNFNRFNKKKSIKINEVENLKNEQIHNSSKTQSYFNCPSCQQIINLENETPDSITISCPNCGITMLIQSVQKKQKNSHRTTLNIFNKDTKLVNTRREIFKSITGVKITGIISIIIGITMQITPNLFSIKISFTFIIIGAIILILIPSNRSSFIKSKNKKNTINYGDNSTPQNNSAIKSIDTPLIERFYNSEMIVIALILWISFFYFITGDNNIDIFFIFIYLGILMIKVIIDEFLTLQQKQRMNILVITFFIIFIIIVIKRIISIVRI